MFKNPRETLRTDHRRASLAKSHSEITRVLHTRNSLQFTGFSHFHDTKTCGRRFSTRRYSAATKGYDGDTMRRNEAHNLISQDQLNEKPMEARVARIESDVAHIKLNLATVQLDVRELRTDLKAANDAIGEVKNAVTAVDCRVTALESRLESKIDSKVNALETKLIKWIIGTMLTCIGTMIACTGVALAIAKAVFGNKVP